MAQPNTSELPYFSKDLETALGILESIREYDNEEERLEALMNSDPPAVAIVVLLLRGEAGDIYQAQELLLRAHTRYPDGPDREWCELSACVAVKLAEYGEYDRVSDVMGDWALTGKCLELRSAVERRIDYIRAHDAC